MTAATAPSARARFREAYAEHRAAEGRRVDSAMLEALPYVQDGPFVREWAVRARTFEAFQRHVVGPASGLKILDLGAGAGWLCYRMSRAGHQTFALDWRWDHVDGLGAAGVRPAFSRVGASFETLPLRDHAFDVSVFNAAIHYAEDLRAALAEVRRVTRPGGTIAILDSPFYSNREDGERMVEEKRRNAARVFGDRAPALLAIRPIEYLTSERLAEASSGLGLAWRRHRVRYPLWYELRPLVAVFSRRRAPSRFDLWTARVP